MCLLSSGQRSPDLLQAPHRRIDKLSLNDPTTSIIGVVVLHTYLVSGVLYIQIRKVCYMMSVRPSFPLQLFSLPCCSHLSASTVQGQVCSQGTGRHPLKPVRQIASVIEEVLSHYLSLESDRIHIAITFAPQSAFSYFFLRC